MPWLAPVVALVGTAASTASAAAGRQQQANQASQASSSGAVQGLEQKAPQMPQAIQLPDMGISGPAQSANAQPYVNNIQSMMQDFNGPQIDTAGKNVIDVMPTSSDVTDVPVTSSGDSSGSGALPWIQGASTLGGLAGTVAKLTEQRPLQNVQTPRGDTNFPYSHQNLIQMLHELATMGRS